MGLAVWDATSLVQPGGKGQCFAAEQTRDGGEPVIKLANLDDIPEDRGLRVDVDEKAIALFRVGEEVHAIDAICPHVGGPLDAGYIEGEVVACPFHLWEFDVTTGKCLNTGETIERFDVVVRDGAVYWENCEF